MLLYRNPLFINTEQNRLGGEENENKYELTKYGVISIDVYGRNTVIGFLSNVRVMLIPGKRKLKIGN